MTDLLTTPEVAVVGVGEMVVGAAARERTLSTYGLGSCVGLSAYDPVARIGAMLHYMLPEPLMRQPEVAMPPCTYATTGVASMFLGLLEAGASKQRLLVCAAGAAQTIGVHTALAVGARNHTMLLELLRNEGVILVAADLGGRVARTMSLDLATGRVVVKTRDGAKTLWSAATLA